MTEVAPIVVLPPLRGGYTSSNLFVALVGKSGSGKTASLGASESLRQWTHFTEGIGSGEGLVKVFGAPQKKDGVWATVMHKDRVLVVEDEIDNLAAVKDRSGSTMMPIIRKMWGGGECKFSYADPSKATRLLAHSYRLGLIVGVQPGRGAALFDDADAGTPQRFLWASVYDNDAPDVRPAMPGPLPWRVPPNPDTDALIDMSGFGRKYIVIEVSDNVRAEIDDHQFRSLKGETSDIEEAKGHGMLTRLKVAAALGLLDGRYSVSDEDWSLAEFVMASSDAARQVVADELRVEANRLAKSKITQAAEGIALGTARAESKQRDGALRNGARQAAKHVRKMECGDSGCTRKCISPSIAGRDRKIVAVGEMLDFAVEKGWLVVGSRSRGSGSKGEIVTTYTAGAAPS